MLKDSRSYKPSDAAEWSAPIVRAARRATYAMFFADGLGFGIWAGHIPARLVFGAPVPADHLPASVDPAGRDVIVNPAFGDVSPAASGHPG